MRHKDLGSLFLGSFKQGKCPPKIENKDRILVIYDDLHYYAYESKNQEMDEYIVNLFIEISEHESGAFGHLSASFNSDKIFYAFDTHAEVSEVEIISTFN